MLVRTVILVLFLIPHVEAGEVEEVAAIAAKYNIPTEVRLDDNTRVDLLTKHHAIEADWSSKWAEGIGQALFYALKTKRQPSVLLLIKKSRQESGASTRDLERCMLVCKRYKIQLQIAYEGDPEVFRIYQPPRESE